MTVISHGVTFQSNQHKMCGLPFSHAPDWQGIIGAKTVYNAGVAKLRAQPIIIVGNSGPPRSFKRQLKVIS